MKQYVLLSLSILSLGSVMQSMSSSGRTVEKLKLSNQTAKRAFEEQRNLDQKNLITYIAACKSLAQGCDIFLENSSQGINLNGNVDCIPGVYRKADTQAHSLHAAAGAAY